MSILRHLYGAIAISLFFLNTIFWCVLLFLLIPFKLLAPSRGLRAWASRGMVALSENWISCNDFEIERMGGVRWHVEGLEGLSRERSYLVSANHQSWVDIVVLQHVFNRRIPFLRFFLKRELMYVPFLGLAWWALDFPFMRRYSKAYLERYPEKRGQDLETTRRACERFQGQPISVLNFLEGTRLTPQKQARQKSSYQHLLMPKTGGIAFVLEAMGAQFDALLDVTIHYPQGRKTMWDLFTGRLHDIRVHVQALPIPRAFLNGRYQEDESHREAIQAWVREIWTNKDERLRRLHAPLSLTPNAPH